MDQEAAAQVDAGLAFLERGTSERDQVEAAVECMVHRVGHLEGVMHQGLQELATADLSDKATQERVEDLLEVMGHEVGFVLYELSDLSVDELLSSLTDSRMRCGERSKMTQEDHDELHDIIRELESRGLGPTMSLEEARAKAVELGIAEPDEEQQPSKA